MDETVNKVRGETNMEVLIFAGNILIWWKSIISHEP
jgi:hypothetical protein